MSEYKIPFNKPSLVGNEIEYIVQAVRGGQASGDGPFTKKCHRFLEEALGVPKVLLTTSCCNPGAGRKQCTYRSDWPELVCQPHLVVHNEEVMSEEGPDSWYRKCPS